jgi:hypothetical protein
MNAAEQFFYDNAGYSYSQTENPEDARVRNAQQLARAVAWAASNGAWFRWTQDDMTNREFTDEGDEYPLWVCAASMPSRETEYLGGCDFGPISNWPANDNYARVIEAELAVQLMLQGSPEGE